MRTTWNKANLYGIVLQWTAIYDSAFEQILRTVGHEARSAMLRTVDARQSGDDDYADVVMDSEADLVEDLIGTACVLCQTQITRVVSSVKRFHDLAKRETPSLVLVTTKGSKGDMLRFGPATSTGPTAVELLDAFANYFKHQSEWTTVDWSRLGGLARATAIAIQAAGASSGSTGNCRTGFKHLLGHCDYDRVVELAGLVAKWRDGLLAAYQGELSSLGLV